HVGPWGGFRSRKGKRFHALLKLSDDFKAEFDFGSNGQENGAAQAVDFSSQEALGKCPKCGGRVFELGMSYICENSVGPEKTCKFKLSKTILGREISKEQAQKLVMLGKTDLLDGFISKRGRPFSAYLKLEDGKIRFEFPEKTAQSSEGKQGKNELVS